MSFYHAEVVNLSLKNVNVLNNYKIIASKKRFWGLVKIYTLLIPSEKIEEVSAISYQRNFTVDKNCISNVR